MLRASAFISEKSRARSAREEKYYITSSIFLFLSGILLILIPVFERHSIFVLGAGWTLLAVLALALLRPLFFSRGLTDIVMAILTSCFYALCGWAISGTSIYLIQNYRIALCFALFFSGISRILAYTRMIVITNLSLMAICGLAEMTASVLLFMGWPDGRVQLMYWILGMAVIISAFEAVFEAFKLRYI